MGERHRHPKLVMNDITGVSAPGSIERVNTMQITKNTEARSKTVLSVIVGLGIGVLFALVVAQFAGMTVGAFVAVACMFLVPFLAVTRVKDATQQARWRRAMETMKSRKVEGNVFYVNSTHAENIVDVKEMIVL